jgi:hypothetical protein
MHVSLCTNLLVRRIWGRFLFRDPPLFTGKLLIKFQNILRNTTQVIIRHTCRLKFLFSVISRPITLERQKWKSSKMKGILLSMMENMIFTLCRMITWVVFLRMFWNFTRSLPMKRGGSLSFLTIFTQVIIRHTCRLKFLFSVISRPITLERQKWKSSKMKGILLSSPVSFW